MALVVTLILLSVTLVMTIAFLAVSRRERASVTTSTEITTARLAADTALAAAQAQMLANILTTNAALYNYHLLVSTNYISGGGFVSGVANPANVNYSYATGNVLQGGPANNYDFEQNVANLQFLPRVPVLVSTNEPAGRFYLDLNRNNVFDDTGFVSETNFEGLATGNTIEAIGDPQWVGVLERPGSPHAPDNKFLSRYAFIALPVGESLDINAIHNDARRTYGGADDGYLRNQGVGSWELNFAAFLADLNTNQWFQNPVTLASYYDYEPTYVSGPISQYRAFDDAVALLNYRYGGGYGFLNSAVNLFLNTANYPFNVDVYSDGPLQTTVNTNASSDYISFSWSGADNTNRFYNLMADLFDSSKTAVGVSPVAVAAGNYFSGRLSAAGNTVVAGARPTYDRYTFYRMLDQLGTDSLPDDLRMNLNYDNLDRDGNVIPGAETNLIAWTPLRFFTNAANRLLLTYTTNWFQKNPSNFLATYYGITGNAANYYHIDGYGNIITNDPTGFGLTNVPFFGMTNEIPGFGIGNLPVMANGKFIYSPSINRLMQLAANIYDAGNNDFYPHTYRPIFERRAGGVFVINFQEVTPFNSLALVSALPIAPELLTNTSYAANTPIYENVYDVPWILGAKKHLPNFNGFYSYNTMQVARKLQFIRDPAAVGKDYNATTSGLYYTNQMILLGVTNSVGFSMWNSYSTNYAQGVDNYPFVSTGPNITIFATNITLASMSNGAVNVPVIRNYGVHAQNIVGWPGSFWDVSQIASSDPSQQSFVSGSSNLTILPTDSLVFNSSGNFIGFAAPGWNLPIHVTPVFPHITLYVTNLFQAYILDHNYVVDYVHFRSASKPADLADYLKDPPGGSTTTRYMWSTDLNGYGLNYGVANQIYVSQYATGIPPGGRWTTPTGVPSATPQKEAGTFNAFFIANYTSRGVSYTNTQLTNQAPYSPVRTVVTPSVSVANDPLVHYLVSDLRQSIGDLDGNGSQKYDDPNSPNITPPNLSGLSKRYQPWGRREDNNSLTGNLLNQDESKFHLALKDSLVWGSDYWDFPTNKFPSAGWLGRVHRGTPWQSVYLKATNLLEFVDSLQANPYVGYSTWMTWLGDTDAFDAANSRPIQDDLLFDIFTAAPHPNASRGTLSVNQTHLASWSAVLSGLVVLTNITEVPSSDFPPVLLNTNIEPAGVDLANSAVWRIVNGPDGINATRADKNIFPNGAFRRIGDILRVPALTENSPFINFNEAASTDDRRRMDISDELYEWLPQQMMGLLRVSGAPRFVVYSYGQTLKPAPGGTVLGSAFFGLVTNYQVVAESATRAVITVTPVLTNAVVNGVVSPMTNYTTRVESFNVLPPE